jgi:enoyl-CoA hydratase
MPPADEKEILTAVNGRVLEVILNRPEARNSLNLALVDELATALERLDSDPDLVAGILYGSGDVFSAGMDLKAFLAGDQVWDGDGQRVGLKQIVTSSTRRPLIAAIEGFAVAGGLELALHCDVIVAGRSAKLGIPEVTRSLVAAAGALRRLPRRVGAGRAMRLALTGELIGAEEGFRIGLVDELVDDGDAVAAASRIAAAISANGPLAVSASKEILLGQDGWSDDEFWERQEAIIEPVFGSADAAEGAKAFAAKRPPRWRGE